MMATSKAVPLNVDGAKSDSSEFMEIEKEPVPQTSPVEPIRIEGVEPDIVYPDTLHLALATIALMVAVFLVAIDVHILATATPKITTEFDSLLDLTWYGGAYLLAQIALQPTYARLYQVFPIKMVFVGAIMTLEIGSIIGAESSSSRMLIIGRSLQGTGAGGVLAGGLLMINYLVPKPKRPVYLSTIASMYSVAAVVGPVLGGVFAESRVTWRFCFWINLPIGLVACAAILFALKEPSRPSTAQPLMSKIKMLDPLGASVLIAWVTCLLLALQRASIPQPWSDSGIWGPLLAFGILFCIFIIVQYYQKDRAIIPYRIISQRTIAFCCLFEVTIFLGTTTIVYYLPFYFQSVKGFTPHQSGIFILPFVVTNSFFAFAGGVVISKTGYYVPFMWGGSAIMVVGCGLLYTLNINSSTSAIVGFQMIASIGYGLCVQVPFTAVQVLPGKDIAVGNGLVAFFQGLGGALSVSAAQTIFSNALHQSLEKIPEVSADVIVSYGATSFVSKVPSNLVHAVREAYGVATRDAFMLTIVGSGLAFLASFGVEWRRHHVPKRNTRQEEHGVMQREIVESK